MNKTAIRLAAAVALLGVGIWVGTSWRTDAEGASVTPGSADDPVVTKSYVDKQVGGGDAQKKELQAMIDAFKADLANQPTGSVKSEVVNLKPGQTLMAAAGAQFVLRAGKGIAYSSDTNGLSDVTEGTDIKSGSPVPNNHLILFPREGRGVMPDPALNSVLVVLVQGDYTIKEAQS